LLARKTGEFDIQMQYETRVSSDKGENGFTMPTPSGLISQLDLTVVNLDVDVESPQAVSVQSEHAGSNTVAKLVLIARAGVDRLEAAQPRCHAGEAGVLRGDRAALRAVGGSHRRRALRFHPPGPGRTGELILDVPPGATITDVIEIQPITAPWFRCGASIPTRANCASRLNPAQSRPFVVLVRSQAPPVRCRSSNPSACSRWRTRPDKLALAGMATGGEVQLDASARRRFPPINLEDFPGDAVAALARANSGLTLRRAFRYSDTQTAQR
jgi:hypothetical protein